MNGKIHIAQLAIIGTAGRKDDAAKINLPLWSGMKRIVYKYIRENNIKTIISGGAAVADSLAVGLYNAEIVEKLTLALPCEFDWHNCQFKDTGEFDWQKNPGGDSNRFHRAFSRVIGQNSLEWIRLAIYNDAEVVVGDGFHDRNNLVAQAERVIAFTFGNGAKIKDGGTADTCRKYLANGGKFLTHVDLNAMTVYEKGEV